MALLAVGINAFSKQSNIQKKEVKRLVEVLNHALSDEFAHINSQISSDAAFDEVKQIIKQNLESIKVPFAFVNAVKHELTFEQRTFVIDILQNLKALSATTTHDLMLMAEVRSEALNKALEKYGSDLMQKNLHDCSGQERIAYVKKLHKIDLHDESFNLLKNFMCQCAYLEDLCLIGNGEDENDYIQNTLCIVPDTIAFLFVTFNDRYFVPGWKKKFKKCGDIFAIVHMVSSSLLDAIDQK